MTFQEAVAAIGTLGVPTVFLLIIAFALWRSLRYLAPLARDVVAAHKRFLASMEAAIHAIRGEQARQGEELKRHGDALDELRRTADASPDRTRRAALSSGA